MVAKLNIFYFSIIKGWIISVKYSTVLSSSLSEAKPGLDLQSCVTSLGQGQLMRANKSKLYSESLPALKICKDLGEVVANLWSWQLRLFISADPLTFS